MQDQPDAVRQRLEALRRELQRELAEVARVEGDQSGSVELRPTNDRAVAVAWSDWGNELQVETLGGVGGRWELGREEADVAFVEEAVRAAVDGRVHEVFGENRSTVTLTLSDGSTATATGYGSGLSGCLPSLGWRRRGRTVQYEPYRR